VKDIKVATDDRLEDSFRSRVISAFPSLCADSLPHDGPAARQLDGSPFRVKLRLKEGIQPQRLLRDGSPGELRFVWDGRSVNRVIKADSFLIPRVEDLIERITRLKHEANAKGITEMWISMGLLMASQEMQRFAEGALQPFSSNTTFEYTDAQGTTKRTHGTEAVYIDDTCVVSFGTREEHEILLLRVLKRMDVHNLKMHPFKCDFLRHENHFLDTSFGLMTFLLRIPKFRLLRMGHPSPTFEVCVHSCLCTVITANTFGDLLRLLLL
jgi:hypothetical protein